MRKFSICPNFLPQEFLVVLLNNLFFLSQYKQGAIKFTAAVPFGSDVVGARTDSHCWPPFEKIASRNEALSCI